MLLHLTRSSVALSDDIEAPHARSLTVPEATSLRTALQLVDRLPYLAAIAGGRATWVAYLHNRPVAVLAQQWQQPTLLLPDMLLPPETALHFDYRQQQDPHAVVAALRGLSGPLG